MVVIINELSLAGQFTQESFIEELPALIKLFRAFDLIKLQLSKKSNFYDQKIVGATGFRDFVTKTRVDEITRFKSVLVPLTDREPFWDANPKHTCDDSYVSAFTEETCQYGLAESIETDQVVFSFTHEDFESDTLKVTKNSIDIQAHNIKQIDSFLSYMFQKQPDFDYEAIIPEKTEKTAFFPNSVLSNILLNAENIEKDNARLHQNIRIDNYKKAGPKIANINLWQYCPATTKKNDRDIFKRRIQAGFYYLSIDTQHGRFELFDGKGEHIGEYHFTGIEVPGSMRTRNITV